MSDFFQNVFGSDFMPHAHCYLWHKDVLWLHVISDVSIALAYFTIPAALVYFVRNRKDIVFSGIFVMFAAFILACGMTHIFEAWTVWHPIYRISGLMKAVTAVISIATSVAVWRLMPAALSLPSPAQLRSALLDREAEIHRRSQAEAELRSAQAVLEERVRLRTVELADANDALRVAKEEAERASRAKSEFLSRMSHELRTPMNAVLGFGQILEMDPRVENPQRAAVDQILLAGRHLLALIDEVLDISRIEAGGVKVEREFVNAGAVVESCAELLRPLAAPRGVRLEVDPSLHVDGKVLADRTRFKQVVLNLFSNAIKYNRPNGSVTATCENVGSGRVRVVVRDTGHGMSADELKRCFAPFERLQAEGSGVEGSGLGLTLSERLVKLMGGQLGAESVVGQGSTFWIELPSYQGTDDRGPARAEAPRPIAARSNEALTVLYIEDNLSNLTLIERILEHRPGITLHPAMQGRLGLDLAREQRPDLILLDLQLPDMPGAELLKRLQNDPATQSIPVLILSADASPTTRAAMLTAGAQHYFAKPIDVRQFLEVLDSFLRESGSGKQ